VNLVSGLRAADPRVDVVVRAFLLQRLGLSDDDLAREAVEEVYREVLRTFVAGHYVVGAVRLLERLDAQADRAHPVDLEFHGPLTTATVPLGDGDGDDALRLVLEDDRVYLPPDLDPAGRHALTADDAEALAYALLRLVTLARTEPSDPPTHRRPPEE
jgi:hypothetical protein